MASYGSSQSGDRRRQHGQKSVITRVRTGCLTCRKRRKKCDERRPSCLHCEKTNIYCEGYQQTVYWESRAALKRSSAAKASFETLDPNVQNYPVEAVVVPPACGIFGGYSNHWPDIQPSPSYYTGTKTSNNEPDPNLDIVFGQIGIAATFESPSTPTNESSTQGGFLEGCWNQHQDTQSFPSETWKTFLPPALPFPISGVETPIHQRLFCHFTTVMSHILTTFAEDCNPFNAVVIPLALRDRTVMDTLLGLAGLHLLKAQNTKNPESELVKENTRLHNSAIKTQSGCMNLMKKHAAQPSSCIFDHEAVLTTSLLLCLYEICDGSGNEEWRKHLNMARQVINQASTPKGDATSQTETLTTEINPFLLEFFVYHESLATVTVPTVSKAKRHFDSLDSLPVQNTSLVGVQDGLIDFIERIAALRTQAEASHLRPDGNVICKAMAIWTDLNNWQPNPEWAKPRQLITTFYQRALFIWLFSVMYPDGRADEKVQTIVRNTTISMAEIKPDDGVMACLLFPLFIVATAAITPQDRDAISAHFRRLRAWSSLGNIDLTYQIVEKMWEDHDRGVPGCWDWVKQLQSHNLSFMVT